jgi:hypothetical protein
MMIHEFKPETLEEKKKRLEEVEANRIFKSATYRETVTRIADLMYKQMYYAKIRHDANNPKAIGNVNFWFETKDNKPMLMYNKHPKNWDKDAVILQIEQEEHQLLYKGRTPGQ